MKAYIIGVGPGDPGLLTVRGLERIKECDVVTGWKSVLERFSSLLEGKKVVELNYREELARLREAFSSGGKVCVLDHGDPSVSDFQFVEKVKKVASELGYEVEVIPGVSSVNAVMGRLGLDLANVIYYTMHVRGDEGELFKGLEEILKCRGYRKLILFPPPDSKGVSRVAKFLLERLGDVEAVVLERVTFPDEKVIRTKLSDLLDYENPDLVVMVV